MFIIILSAADNMIIGTVLPDISSAFLVGKSFERRHKLRGNGILYCRDRRNAELFISPYLYVEIGDEVLEIENIKEYQGD